MQTFALGSRQRFTASFVDLINNIAADPTTVTLKLRDPTAAEVSYTLAAGQVTRQSTGIYYCDVTLSVAGLWDSRWVAGGAVVAVFEAEFTVSPSDFRSP